MITKAVFFLNLSLVLVSLGAERLELVASYQAARQAMSDGLHEIALRKISALKNQKELAPELSDEEKHHLNEIEGELLIRTNRSEEGLAKLTKSQQGRGVFWRGIALSRLGRGDEAIVQWKKLSAAESLPLRQAAVDETRQLYLSQDEVMEALAVLDDQTWELPAEWLLLRKGLILLDNRKTELLAETLAKFFEDKQLRSPEWLYLKAALAFEESRQGKLSHSKEAESALDLLSELRNGKARENGLSKEVDYLQQRLFPEILSSMGKKQEAIGAYAELISAQDSPEELSLLFSQLKQMVTVEEIDSLAEEALTSQLDEWASQAEGLAKSGEISVLDFPVIVLSEEARLFKAQRQSWKLSPERQSYAENRQEVLNELETLVLTATDPRIVKEAELERGLIFLNVWFILAEDKVEKGKGAGAVDLFARSDEAYPTTQSLFNRWLLSFEYGAAGTESFKSATLDLLTDSADRNRLAFERARYLARINDPQADAILEEFVAERSAKEEGNLLLSRARLILAKRYLSQNKVDQAGSQLASVKPNELSALSPSDRLEWALSSLDVRRRNGQRIHTVGFENLDLPQESKDILSLKTAESYYLNEEFNKAQGLFTELSQSLQSESARRSALYFAAQSALKVGTPQAASEGLLILSELMGKEDLSDDLARRACVKSIRYRLSTGQLKEALVLVARLTEASPLTVQESLLTADVYFAAGGGDKRYYEKSLQLYKSLEGEGLAEKAPKWRYELAYLKGLCLERLDRTVEARELYYDILNQDERVIHAEEDWEVFYRVGFRLVYLLEKEQRWSAAAKVAKIVAAYADGALKKGSRADEAAKRSALLEKK